MDSDDNLEQRIEQLKAELAQLEGQTVSDTAPADPDAVLRAFFEKEEAEGPIRETLRREQENTVTKLCANCYTRQPIETDSCSLCHQASGAWFPSWELPIPAGGRTEQEMLVEVATSYTLDQLRVASGSGWTSRGENPKERQRLVESLIKLRGGQQQLNAKRVPEMLAPYTFEPITVSFTERE